MRIVLLLLALCGISYGADPVTLGLGSGPAGSGAAFTGGTAPANTQILYSNGSTVSGDPNFTDNGSSVVTDSYTTGVAGSTVGAFVVGNGTAATSVSIGAGSLAIGNAITIASTASAYSGSAGTNIYRGNSGPFNANALVLQDGGTTTAGGGIFFGVNNGASTSTVGQIGGTAPAANTFGGTIAFGRNNAAADTAGAIGQSIAGTGTTTYTNYTTTATYQQVDTISLTAGKWHIYGHGTFSSNAATLTVSTNNIWVISTVTASATGAVEGSGNIVYIPEALMTGLSQKESGMLDMIVNISATTSYFLNSQGTFTVGNPQFVGSLEADRMN